MLNSAMLKVHRSSLSNTRSSLLMWSWPARPMFHTQLLSTYAKRVCSSHSVLGFSSFFSSGFASPGLVSGGAWAIGTGVRGFWKRLCAYAGALNAMMIASIFFISFYGLLTRAPGRHRRHRRRLRARRAQRVHERRRPLDLGIPVDPHLGHVQALQLGLGADAHAEDYVVDLEEHPRRHEDEREAGHGADDLRDELARAAVEEAAHRALDAVEAVAVGAVGEEPEAQYPPRPVDAVD